ncbi:MAG: outer membrane protein assembly factor BamD [Planctomycetes bacterium]|nr:outer membrane protein assembly factor BamD [Planctomycetota bacterium]
MTGLLLAVCWLGIAGCKSTVDSVDIKETYGPIGRLAKNRAEQAKRDKSDEPYVGLEQFNAAKKLYDEQKYAEARKAFHKIAKTKKWKNEPVVEEARFYRAESDFQLGHYPAAQDGYDELLKNHPSTKYLEHSVKRLYAIACFWLKSPKPASEVELASFKEENGEELLAKNPDARAPFQWRFLPNFTNKTEPVFDTPGRAVQALRSVTLNDVSGPLADDALMQLALYHLRRADYREAETYFEEIRKNHSNSEFVQAAYILGEHASLKSYQGVNYDGKQLLEARNLAEATNRNYPNSPQRQKLEADLARIRVEIVERDWKRVEYYMRRGEKESAAVYCEIIMEQYPDSVQAARARETLLKIGPKYAAGILSRPLFVKDAPVPSESEDDEDPDELMEPRRLDDSEGNEGGSAAPTGE